MRFTVSIKDNRSFRALYRSRMSAVTPYFVLYCRKNRLGSNRLGLTVGTKLGGAVRRNRIKRRLRELYRLNESALAIPYDMVIVARHKAFSAPFHALQSAFIHACAELGLMPKEKKKAVPS